MAPWDCAIGGCDSSFDHLEALIAHQVSGHPSHECRICGDVVPEGFFAIKHTVEDHSRAEYVRHYGANSDAIRERESLVEDVEEAIDVAALRRRLEDAGADAAQAEAVK